MKHSDNHGAQSRKIPLWLVGILILLALFSGSSLVMSIQAHSRTNAMQQQVAAYEEQLDAAIQNQTAGLSPEQASEESPTPEPEGQTAVSNNAAAQTKQPVQTTPQPTAQPTIKPAAQPAAQTQPPVQKQEITVYVTKTGDCYHSGDCSHLRQSKVPTTLEAAKAQGYRRCSKCDAPR